MLGQLLKTFVCFQHLLKRIILYQYQCFMQFYQQKLNLISSTKINMIKETFEQLKINVLVNNCN